MNPDPNKFYTTSEAATLAHMTEHGIRKILRGKKDGRKALPAHRIKVNKKTQWFIEKWVYHIFLENEVARWEKHLQDLRESLANPEEKIKNGRRKT
jgi:hypothetical protein